MDNDEIEEEEDRTDKDKYVPKSMT